MKTKIEGEIMLDYNNLNQLTLEFENWRAEKNIFLFFNYFFYLDLQL